MSKLSMGLNIPKKHSLGSRPPPAKRKTIFDDDDSSPEDNQPTTNPTSNIQSITTLDGSPTWSPSKLTTTTNTTVASSPPSKSKARPTNPPPAPPKRALNPPQPAENISSKYTTLKHAKEAETLDPSIYDYDGIYDAMKAPPPPSSTTANPSDSGGKPKYMASLKAAAEIRKRDAIRAQDRKTAREREAEGDEFHDKEKFVTGAYRRQQEELRRLEEEEKRREGDEDKRRKKGGGMGGFYRGLLEEEERKHQMIVRAVEEGKGKVGSSGKTDGDEGEKKGEGKSEEEIAREKGVTLNEEGEVVDKRELLKAGLNTVGGARVKKPMPLKNSGEEGRRKGETERERETREFEEMLLGKHGLSDDDEDTGADNRASKSRRMEDELLAGLGSP